MCKWTYRGVNKGLYVLLSRSQAGPGRTVKQELEEISRNHVHTFIHLSAVVFSLTANVSSLFPLPYPTYIPNRLVGFPVILLAAVGNRRSTNGMDTTLTRTFVYGAGN